MTSPPLDTKIRELLRLDTIRHNLIFIEINYIGEKRSMRKKGKERREGKIE